MNTLEIIRNGLMQCIEKIEALAKRVVKISTLESKTSTLESKTATLESKTSTLESKTSTLESKTSTLEGRAEELVTKLITRNSICALHSIDDGRDILFDNGVAELKGSGSERYIISGFPKRITFYYNSKEIIFLNFDTYAVTDMSSMFEYCGNLTSLDVSNFNTAAVTNMSSMFFNCVKLTTLDLSSFDTSSVTNMGNMFNSCRVITSLNISNFNTSSVTYMQGMFLDCNNLTSLDLSSFDTSSVTNMNKMFYNCYSLISIIGTHTLEEVQAGTVKAMRGLKVSISFSDSPNLERASILALFYGLADLTGQTSQTVTLHATAKARLTAEDIKIATDKNWIVQ